MKFGYYGYRLREVGSGHEFLVDARNFFRAFCQFNSPEYKNKFTRDGENLYLINISGDLHLFIQSKNLEIIKKINSNSTTVAEISDLLEQGEMIGFAAYVYISRHFLGFASTVMAPRAKAFGEFVNSVIASTGNTNYQFILNPFFSEATRAEVLNLPFVGKSVIQVSRENSFFGHLRDMVGGSGTEFDDVDSFELAIKPKPRKNISTPVQRVVGAVSEDGLDKLIISAKNDLHDRLTDYYVAGKGMICDHVDPVDQAVLAQRIREKIDENGALADKVTEHEQNEAFSSNTIEFISQFGVVARWTEHFTNI